MSYASGSINLSRPYLDQITSDCSMSPNGTETKSHFFSCSSSAGSRPTLFIHDAAVTNSSGDEAFPVDLRQTVRFFFDVTSSKTKRRFDNMVVEISLYKRYNGWLGCGWIFTPTFGLMNNLNLCDDNLSCPIRPGRQVVELTIKPSQMLRQVLNVVHEESVRPTLYFDCASQETFRFPTR
uniref:ML domain-containing protein n=1 Tax=Steinernema glaseri TaxID=37863 RepID=A0A1I7XZJ7_9BILA